VELPLDVQVHILAFLHTDHLKTARMVPSFRDASKLCVTKLSCSCGLWWKIKRRLQYFNSVKILDLAIRRARYASLLRQPGVLSRLRELRLTCPRLAAVIPLVAAAPQLSKLEVEVEVASWCNGKRFRSQLVKALRSCRRPVEVTLRLWDYMWVSLNYTEFEGIDETPILRLIVHGISLSGLPAGQVPLTHFTRLQCLDIVQAQTYDEIGALATLTQLTRLALETKPSMGMQQLMPLSHLTALQELELVGFEELCMRGFRLVVSPMAHLRKLTLQSARYNLRRWYLDLADTDSLLAALPAVTCLELLFAKCTPQLLPGAFLSNGFVGLRKLELALQGSPEHLAQLATVLPELGSLDFYGDCRSLLSHLPPMPRLTELEIKQSCAFNVKLSGNVFAKFQSLQRLRLCLVLDVKQWNEDVQSLAVLTNLTDLTISISGLGSSGWHVTSEELMPLTALKHLRRLELFPILASEADVNEFWAAMKAIRHEMGFSSAVVPTHE
jgi:hypothetical protein